MLVEVEEDASNVTFAFDDNAWFKLLLQHYIQGNPHEEVNKDISNVTLAGDDSASLFAHKIIHITFSLYFKCLI